MYKVSLHKGLKKKTEKKNITLSSKLTFLIPYCKVDYGTIHFLSQFLAIMIIGDFKLLPLEGEENFK